MIDIFLGVLTVKKIQNLFICSCPIIDIELSIGGQIVKMYRIFQALMALILLACLSGVQGQYNTSTIGYPATAPNTAQVTAQYAQYSQYYTMNTGTAPSAHISVPQPYDITGNVPTTVYFSNQMQPVPFSQYQSNPTYSGSNSLWIKGTTAWSQYAVVPVGANVSLLAISPTGGSGVLNFVDSNGQTYSYNYFFYPVSQLNFYADTPGRHTISFVVGGITSNPVVIDVTGTMTMTYAPTNSYYPPISSYPSYYSPINPISYNDPQAALELADLNKAYQKAYGNYYDNSAWYYYAYSWLNAP
jgi:hypothetical protein